MTSDEGVSVAADERLEAALLIDTENLFYVYAPSHEEARRTLRIPGLDKARVGWSNAGVEAQLSLRAVIDWAERVVGHRAVTTKSGFGKVRDPSYKLLVDRITEDWTRTTGGERFFWPGVGDAGWITHNRSVDRPNQAELDLIAEFHLLRGASPRVDTFVFGGSDGRVRDALHGVLWGRQVASGWWDEDPNVRNYKPLGSAKYDGDGNPEQQEVVRFAFAVDGRNAARLRRGRWAALLNSANGALLRQEECPWRPPGSNVPSGWFFATLAQIRTSLDEAAKRSLTTAATRAAAPVAARGTAVEPPWLELAELFWSEKFERRVHTGKPRLGEIGDKREALTRALPGRLQPHLDAMLARWADVFATHAEAARDYDIAGPTSPNWRRKLAAAMLVPIAELNRSLTNVHRADDAFQLARRWLGYQEKPRDV